MRQEVACCCLGYVIYIVGFVALIVGIASPQWYEMEAEWLGSKLHTSVFTACYKVPLFEDDCGRVKLEDSPDWWQASAALLIVALLLGLVAGFTAMYIPITSGLQIVAGLLAGAGCVLYVMKIEEVEDDYFGVLENVLDLNFLWGFYLAIGGAIVLFLNGFGLAIMSCCYGCHMRCICCCCGGRRRNEVY